MLLAALAVQFMLDGLADFGVIGGGPSGGAGRPHMRAMTGDTIANLIYLLLLLLFVGGWVARGRLGGEGGAFRHAGSWILIFGVAIVGAALWDDIRRDVPRRRSSARAARSRCRGQRTGTIG